MNDGANEEARRILGGKAKATLDDGVEEKASAVTLLKEITAVMQNLGSRIDVKALSETELQVSFRRTPQEGSRANVRYDSGRFEVRGAEDWTSVPVEYSYGPKAWIPTDSNRTHARTAAGVLCQRIVDVAVSITRSAGL